jgi:hypothetical protein
MQQERDGQEYDSKGGEHQQHVSESSATLFVVVEPVPQASTQVHLGLHCAALSCADTCSQQRRQSRAPYRGAVAAAATTAEALGTDPREAWNGHGW